MYNFSRQVNKTDELISRPKFMAPSFTQPLHLDTDVVFIDKLVVTVFNAVTEPLKQNIRCVI